MACILWGNLRTAVNYRLHLHEVWRCKQETKITIHCVRYVFNVQGNNGTNNNNVAAAATAIGRAARAVWRWTRPGGGGGITVARNNPTTTCAASCAVTMSTYIIINHTSPNKIPVHCIREFVIICGVQRVATRVVVQSDTAAVHSQLARWGCGLFMYSLSSVCLGCYIQVPHTSFSSTTGGWYTAALKV